MGGCQSKSATNVVNQSTKPGELPKTGQPSKLEETTRSSLSDRASHVSKHEIHDRFGHSTIYPNAVYVFKTVTTIVDSTDKIFVNIFHHKKVPVGHCLVKDKEVVPDKKGDHCFAYAVVIDDDMRDKCGEEKYKEWLSERIVELLNALIDAQLDVTKIRIPAVKKGFMGNSVPYFSLEEDLVSWKDAVFVKITKPDEPLPNHTVPTVGNGNSHLSHGHGTVASTVATHQDTQNDDGGISSTGPSSTELSKTSNSAPPQLPLPAATVANNSVPLPTSPISVSPPLSATTTSAASDSPPADIVHLPAPKRLTGWMKKQGHIAKNWKTRFFVLDHGFLTYYVDQQEKPPFGVDKKGQLCLAGYRDQALMRRPGSNAFLVPAYDRSLHPVQEGPDGEEEDEEYDQADDEHSSANMISLEFFPQIVDSDVLAELKRRNGDLSNYETHKEFLLVCRTPQERDGWLAALDAHTAYIENVALQFISDRNKLTAENLNNPSPVEPTPKPRSMSISSSISFLSSSRRSVSGKQVSRASRKASIALSAQKWSVFLNKNEKVVLMGIVDKPNPVGYRYMRELLLVQRVDENDDNVVCRKRLIYIDSNSYEKKGEVLWLENSSKFPKVSVIGDRFEVLDVNNKNYVFYPRDDLTPEQWEAEINNLPPN